MDEITRPEIVYLLRATLAMILVAHVVLFGLLTMVGQQHRFSRFVRAEGRAILWAVRSLVRGTLYLVEGVLQAVAGGLRRLRGAL